MLRRVDELLGFTIHAADGDIGRVHDLYFDDRRWAVRYLVVDTRHWLPGRRVLLSPAAVRRPDWAHHEIVASLSREQIRRCPGIDSDPPVGRRKIALSRECYTLPYYWALGGFLWTPATRALHAAPVPGTRPPREARRRPGDPHLRSTRLIRGYDVRGTNGDVGHVEGFLIDDESWALCDLVVNARHRLPRRRVLVPSEWIAWVSWIELTVHVDLPIERILGAPSYDPSRPVTGSDEMRLRAYYGRPTRHLRDLTMR